MDRSPALAPAFAAAARCDWLQVSHCLADLEVGDRPSGDLLELSLLALADDDLESARAIGGLLNFDRAVPALLALLQDPNADPEEQWFGVQLLAKCPPTLAVTELAGYLEKAPDSEMAERAVQALVQFGAEAIAQLKILLTIPASKISAVSALARIRHSQTIEPLLFVARDPDPIAQAIAVEALSSFHDPRIPPLLLGKLTDAHSALRQAAVVGLGLRSDLAITMGLVERLTPLLRDPELPVAIAVATALGRMDSDEAVAALTSIETEWHGELGLQLLRSLGWLNRSTAVAALEKILATRPAESGAIEAIRALGQQQANPDRASAVLMNYFVGIPAVFGVRSKQEIATALGNLQGSKLVEHFVLLLGDPNPPVRWQATYCLQQQGIEVRSLLQELATQPDLGSELQSSLAECLNGWPISNAGNQS